MRSRAIVKLGFLSRGVSRRDSEDFYAIMIFRGWSARLYRLSRLGFGFHFPRPGLRFPSSSVARSTRLPFTSIVDALIFISKSKADGTDYRVVKVIETLGSNRYTILRKFYARQFIVSRNKLQHLIFLTNLELFEQLSRVETHAG